MFARVFGLMAAVVLGLWGLAALASPGPAELPPPDFQGRQYIDSRGCVFQRGPDGRWAPRLGPDDRPVCGFPPSLPSRRAGALDGAPGEPALGPEQRLMAVLAEGLRDGELIDDKAEREQIRPPAPVPRPTSGPLAELDAMVAAAPALRAGMASGLRPNDRLCALLGYDGTGQRLPALGQDATQGFCPGLSEQTFAAIPAAKVGESAAEAADPPKPVPPSAAAAPDTAQPPESRPPAARRSAARPKQAPPTARPAQGPEMVPASARYVLVDRFSDQQEADALAGRLSSWGYPAARGRTQTKDAAQIAILAGPFQDRGSVIAALNDIRARGYVRAVAR